MTAKELAEMLSGRETGNETTPREGLSARDAGLVVVYGYSDDNVEFRGAIDEEVGAYEGTTIYLTKDGLLEEPACGIAENIECPYLLDVRDRHPSRDLHHHGGRRTVVHRDRVQHGGCKRGRDGGSD